MEPFTFCIKEPSGEPMENIYGYSRSFASQTGLSYGDVRLRATFCYATETDPQDPINYTRAGLEITFRPDKTKFSKKDNQVSQLPACTTFFSVGGYQTEDELRRDAHTWEPCLKATKTFRSTSLNDPMFDIHYNARRAGAVICRWASDPVRACSDNSCEAIEGLCITKSLNGIGRFCSPYSQYSRFQFAVRNRTRSSAESTAVSLPY